MSQVDIERGSKKKLSVVGEYDLKDDEEPLLQEKSNKKANKNLKKLVIVTCICTVFMIIEVIGGYLASSIA